MNFRIHTSGMTRLFEVISESQVISSVQDALDLLGDAGQQNCSAIIIDEKNLTPEFFDLRSGLAGEILQKFVNYNCRLGITGEFEKYSSKSLRAFILECNRGSQFKFAGNRSELFEKFFKP